jgi:hypothetical protein
MPELFSHQYFPVTGINGWHPLLASMGGFPTATAVFCKLSVLGIRLIDWRRVRYAS